MVPADIDKLSQEITRLKNARSGLNWNRLPVIAPAPDIIIDVGASNGTKNLYKAYPNCRFILVDAIDENREALSAFATQYNVQVIICGVGDRPAEMTLNIAGNSAGSRSSFLKRHGVFENDITRPRTVSVRTLDDIVGEGRDSIGLKLDIEGYEGKALAGAGKIIDRVKWIVVETSLSKRFYNDPMFSGIYDILSNRGFIFRDILSIRRNKAGDLRLIDAVFVRSDN